MSDKDYCTCNRRVTRELTRLLKADSDCEECGKRLNPDITAPCYYPRQADHAGPRIPLGGARSGISGSNGDLEQEDRPTGRSDPRPTGRSDPRPTERDTERNQTDPGDDEFWIPGRIATASAFGPPDRTTEGDRAGSTEEQGTPLLRHTLGDIYRVIECDSEDLPTGNQRYLR